MLTAAHDLPAGAVIGPDDLRRTPFAAVSVPVGVLGELAEHVLAVHGQSDQQRLLNQTLTAEALTKQYLEVLHDMKSSNNLVVLVPTEGGLPLLDIAKLKSNLKQ